MIAVWRRSVLGAGGVALLLPIGLALGVLLTSALGGASALRALGQIFVGPTVPGARSGPRAPGLESSRQVPQVPPAPRGASGTRASASGGSAVTPGRPAGTGATPHHSTPAPPATHRPPAQPPSGGGGSPPGDSSGAPPPAPAPSPVHQAGQQAVDTVRQTSPAAAPVADAAQTVVDLLP